MNQEIYFLGIREHFPFLYILHTSNLASEALS